MASMIAADAAADAAGKFADDEVVRRDITSAATGAVRTQTELANDGARGIGTGIAEGVSSLFGMNPKTNTRKEIKKAQKEKEKILGALKRAGISESDKDTLNQNLERVDNEIEKLKQRLEKLLAEGFTDKSSQTYQVISAVMIILIFIGIIYIQFSSSYGPTAKVISMFILVGITLFHAGQVYT